VILPQAETIFRFLFGNEPKRTTESQTSVGDFACEQGVYGEPGK
jgi:hypothetical protein